MRRIVWRLKNIPRLIKSYFSTKWYRTKITIYSLMYNHCLDSSYVADTCMEPLFWFVDNFTGALGPIFVFAVTILTASVVFIAYWIGLPYWWERNPFICIILVIIGHWLLLNVTYNYYKAVVTPPGTPPTGELITEAVSICKKCIAPKPPRTHHCSVCNRCILKMDHHCPWLNNCVGYGNHRYFYLYMVYVVIGVTFIIIGGFDIGYEVLMTLDFEDEIEGHPVKYNKSGVLVPVPAKSYVENEIEEDVRDFRSQIIYDATKRRAIIYMLLINLSVLIALGTLTYWHTNLIKKGETSIEAHINKAETKRLAALDQIYINPYNFGERKNWLLFLGLVRGRTFWRHVLLPSGHRPVGNGLIWNTVYDKYEWP